MTTSKRKKNMNLAQVRAERDALRIELDEERRRRQHTEAIASHVHALSLEEEATAYDARARKADNPQDRVAFQHAAHGIRKARRCLGAPVERNEVSGMPRKRAFVLKSWREQLTHWIAPWKAEEIATREVVTVLKRVPKGEMQTRAATLLMMRLAALRVLAEPDDD